MHVISRKPFNEAILRFPNHMAALVDLLNILEKKMFHTPEEMKQYIPSLDNFKYRNNCLRLIAYIDFKLQKVFVKHIVHHAEYDRLTTYYRGHKE